MADEMESDLEVEAGGRYWVIPGRLLAGPYPLSSDETLKYKTIEILIQNGINHFVDLTEENEIAPHYADLIDRLAPGRRPPLRHTRFSIPDMDIPTRARMKEILDEAFALVGKDIVMAQAKDLDHDGDAGHKAAGEGKLDYSRYLSLLHANGFKGPLLLHGLSEA